MDRNLKTILDYFTLIFSMSFLISTMTLYVYLNFVEGPAIIKVMLALTLFFPALFFWVGHVWRLSKELRKFIKIYWRRKNG